MVLHGLARSVPFSCQDLARLCAKSCQNVMASHGKSWQDLANIFLRAHPMIGNHIPPPPLPPHSLSSPSSLSLLCSLCALNSLVPFLLSLPHPPPPNVRHSSPDPNEVVPIPGCILSCSLHPHPILARGTHLFPPNVLVTYQDEIPGLVHTTVYEGKKTTPTTSTSRARVKATPLSTLHTKPFQS